MQISVTAGIPGYVGTVVLFAVLVPLFLILTVAGVVLFVRTMRNNINPNIRYPERPRLQRHVPASFMIDTESRQLVPSSDLLERAGKAID